MIKIGFVRIGYRWYGAASKSYKNFKKAEIVVQLWKVFWRKRKLRVGTIFSLNLSSF